MTPQEAWKGEKPDVEHFRIFGSIAYAHVPDQRRKKLDDKGEKCIFLGVSEPTKAYKLYNPTTKKIVVSRDVVFDEKNFWPWSSNSDDVSQQIPADFDVDNEVEMQQNQQQTIPDGAAHENVQNDGPETIESTGADSRIDNQLQDSACLRSQRAKRRPAWMSDYQVPGSEIPEDPLVQFALFSDCDPTIYEEAMKEKKWEKAMDNEIAAIEKNDTWELVDLPPGQKSIGVKWVYKTKINEKGEIDKHKARLVAKGYKQEHGIDYMEVFAPVARHDTIRLVTALAACNSWPIFQLDVKSAFLRGDLEEEVFVDQPPGYVKPGNEHKVYRLNKALYGLKQARRAWYSRIDAYFLKEGFKGVHMSTLFTQKLEMMVSWLLCAYTLMISFILEMIVL